MSNMKNFKAKYDGEGYVGLVKVDEMKKTEIKTEMEQCIEIPAREGVIFYESMFRAIKRIPKCYQIEAYDAIFRYAFYGESPQSLSNNAEIIFIQAKPQIDANERKRRNGYLGAKHGVKGASVGKRGGRPKKVASSILKELESIDDQGIK
ncbi:MAG: hypothetical protein IJX68_06375 [Rikenellaceae bacterium]|nr:hypothetical protein [Rikenellaceae bacterium]